MVFRFRDITAFSVALGDAQGSLALPEGETVSDGEWVLAIFEIGSRRRATAAAARGVCAAGDTHIAFERRDWDRLLSFVAARSEHMRAARPVGPVSSGRIPAATDGEPSSSQTPDVDLSRTGERLAWGDSEAPPSSVLDSSRSPFVARVLLVDDSPETREEVRAMLTEIGLVVEAVESAEQAGARLAEVAFDALVLDFQAQGMDPLDFVRSLRRDRDSHRDSRPALPVLVLSNRPSSRDVVDAFASGADDFLPRPFRAPELGARIFGLIRRAKLARVGPVAPNFPHVNGPRSSGRGGSGP